MINFFSKAQKILIDALFNRSTAPSQPRGSFIPFAPLPAGIRVNEDTALTYSAVWGCVNYISGSIAALPWHLFQNLGGSNKKQFPGDLDWLISTAPNSEMSSLTFRETMLSWALLWGNGIAEIEQDKVGRPSALWPIEPNRINIDRDGNGKLVYEIYNERQPNTYLSSENVFHLHGLGSNGISGFSVVSYAARSIGLGIAGEEFGASFFGNGTQLGLVLEHPGRLSQEAKDGIVGTLNDKLRGPKKSFSAMVFEEGMKVANIGMPMTDAQFLETRKFQTTEVARWFRVPPHKIADLDRSTNNNIEHQGIEAIVDCLLPWVVRLELEANRKLCGNTRGRMFTKMNMNGLLRGDIKSRGEFYKAMHSIGAFSTNDILELEDRNTIGKEGDKRLVQLNQTTLEKIGTEQQEPPAQKTEKNDNDTKEAMSDMLYVHVAAATRRAVFRCSEATSKSRDEFFAWLQKFIQKEKIYLKDRLSAALSTVARLNNLPESSGLDALAQLEDQHMVNIEAMATDMFNDQPATSAEDIAKALTSALIEKIYQRGVA